MAPYFIHTFSLVITTVRERLWFYMLIMELVSSLSSFISSNSWSVGFL